LKVAVYHNIPAGGAKRALFNFVKELRKRGHDVDFYGLGMFEEEPFSLIPFANNIYTDNVKRYHSLENLRPYFAMTYINLFKSLRYLNILNKQSKNIAVHIDGRGYDILFIHNCMYTQAPFILRHLKTLRVYYCHEPLRRVYEPIVDRKEEGLPLNKKLRMLLCKPVQLIRNRMLKKIDRENLLSASAVFSNSNYCRESIYRAYGVLATVSSPGVDVEKFRPMGLAKKNYVLSIGVIDYLKQHDFVINSLALVDKNIRPGLIIVGNMSSEKEKRFLTDLAKAKGVDLEMRFLISDDELVALYNEAKAVVYPPLMEPFGLVPLEAMACGTPVIGVREGGIRETIVDGATGILIDRDEGECAQALTRLVTDEDLAKKMGEAGRKYVCEKWSWETCTDRLERNFEKVLKK
jgi:glycosyltransferase involved in cell wall biosynthesis